MLVILKYLKDDQIHGEVDLFPSLLLGEAE